MLSIIDLLLSLSTSWRSRRSSITTIESLISLNDQQYGFHKAISIESLNCIVFTLKNFAKIIVVVKHLIVPCLRISSFSMCFFHFLSLGLEDSSQIASSWLIELALSLIHYFFLIQLPTSYYFQHLFLCICYHLSYKSVIHLYPTFLILNLHYKSRDLRNIVQQHHAHLFPFNSKKVYS